MDKEIKVMLVDDEQEAIDLFIILLNENFPDIKVVATACSSKDAINKIFRKHPDLIFLDIEIDEKNGFDIINKLKQDNHLPYIVFVTAYNKYAVEAFKTNALDYLLKPVEIEDLKRAINKFEEQNNRDSHFRNLQSLLSNHQSKIRFNTHN